MSRKVIIASDSTCDISKEIKEQYNIVTVPLHITYGDENYDDGIDIQLEELYDRVEKTNELPKTAATTPKEFQEFFHKYVDNGYDVFYTGISAAMSSTFQSAKIVSEDDGLAGHVFCVDSKNLSTGIALLLLKACKYRDEGYSAEEIAKKVEELVPHIKSQFVVETLEYLHKGGRCSGTTRFFSAVLRIKPMIVVREGKMAVGKKFIGSSKKAISGMVNMFINDVPHIDPEFVFVTHSLAHDKVSYIKDMIKDVKIDHVYDTVAGCVIGSHCGPGTIGILYIMKDQTVVLENVEEE